MTISPAATTQSLVDARQYWDNAAATFDQEADHGLRDPLVHRAWHDLLLPWLPPAPATLVDIGCGTGSLTLLLAELGHTLTGIDLSPLMLAQAHAKAQQAGQAITFYVMEATNPPLPRQHFDLLLCRHLLWALPAPAAVLRHWAGLLKPGGRLLLIEGYWHTGAGLHAQEVVAALPATMANVLVQSLHEQSALWGGAVTDERYLVVADLPPTND